jgi:hypothetical protein
VYVEGISYQASEEDVTRFFQDKGCGKVVSVRMPRYHDSGRPRGYAHVDFKKPDGVGKALALDGVTMMGRYLSVKRAHEPRQQQGGGFPPPAALQAKPPGICVGVCVRACWWVRDCGFGGGLLGRWWSSWCVRACVRAWLRGGCRGCLKKFEIMP